MPKRGSVMGQPIPYRWLLLMGVGLAVIAGVLFWWSSRVHGRGGVFVSGFGFLAASGVAGCLLLCAYQVCCRWWCHPRTPPLE